MSTLWRGSIWGRFGFGAGVLGSGGRFGDIRSEVGPVRGCQQFVIMVISGEIVSEGTIS